jgi:hypothetical protein
MLVNLKGIHVIACWKIDVKSARHDHKKFLGNGNVHGEKTMRGREKMVGMVCLSP